VHKVSMDQEWLEPALASSLGAVEAPEELWERLQNPRALRSAGSIRGLAWTLAAASALLAILWGLYPRREGNLELRSDEVAEVRRWVKDNTGLEIPLAANPSPLVRLVGARVVSKAPPTAEITFKVGDRDVTLVVSKAVRTPGQVAHRFLTSESYRDAKVSSWTMRGQLYTLACATPGDLRAACLLCHAGAGQLTALN
jgi:hypothetical protein